MILVNRFKIENASFNLIENKKNEKKKVKKNDCKTNIKENNSLINKKEKNTIKIEKKFRFFIK